MQMTRIRIRPRIDPQRSQCVKAPVRIAKLIASLVHKFPVAGIKADCRDRGYGEVAKRRDWGSPSDYAGAVDSRAIHAVEQCRQRDMHYARHRGAAEIAVRKLANAIESPLDVGVINGKCHFLSDICYGAFIAPSTVAEDLK